MRADLPTGTVTFLFTDVEGSTKLLHELGAEAYAEALTEHRLRIREACMAEGGVEVDTQGDAFFFAFSTALGALTAAAAFTDALEPGLIHVRVGLHTGTPHLGSEGYVGEDVHLGARIAATAHGGQVVCSRVTRDLSGLDLVDLGEHRLKDIAEAVSIYQLGEERFSPLNTLSNTNLPTPTSSFVGREQELTEVVSLVRNGARVLTLSGPGGSGKTRVAIEAASELVPDFANAVVWVPLATLRDPALVTETIARTLGASNGLADHIGRRSMLLLLDNLEQVVEAASDLSTLLAECPALQLLVTTREVLRIQGEVEYSVPPLAEREAIELFCARSGLEPGPEIGELCRRLDSLPLAVELAAARTRALTPQQILDRLSRQLDLLQGGRDADPRQQTLRATIAWSYDLLDSDEQSLFGHLAVFVGGCALEAAEEVCDADLDTLQSLVEKSLLRFTNGRYWMLETIREYAAERLEEASAGEEQRERHADYFLALAEELEPPQMGGVDEGWVARVSAETDNFRAALVHFVGHPDPTSELRLAGALFRFWATVGSVGEGSRIAGHALARSEGADPRLRMKVLYAASICAFYQGDLAAAGTYEEERLEIARAVGDGQSEVVALNDLGLSASENGDLETADALLHEGVARAQELGDERLVLSVTSNLGELALKRGQIARAREVLEECVDVATRLGDQWSRAHALETLGFALVAAGEMSLAAARFREGLVLAEVVPLLGSYCLDGLAAVADDPTRAARLAGRAHAMREEAGFLSHDVERGFLEDTERRGREALGDEAWDVAYAEGARMTLEEAIAYALEDRDA
jgi:predicted ATPase